MAWLFAVCAGLQTLLAAVLCFVPLFNLLGYEFAVATGLLAAVTAHVLGRGAAQSSLGWRSTLGVAWAAAAAHLLGGLVLISLNALRVRNCNYLEGLQFWALLPLATALYSATGGWAIGRTLPRRWRGLASTGVLGFPLVAGLVWIYTQPPIFAYDHTWGFVSGSIYDEALTVGAPLLALRAMSGVRIAAVVLAVAGWETRAWRGPIPAVLASVALAMVFGVEPWVGSRAGYRVSRADIEAALPVVAQREGIVVRLPEGTSPEQVAAVADDHAFRLAQLRHVLDLDDSATVTSYVYADRAQKARLMGASNTQIAKPWQREIHLHEVRAEHPVLAHELVHALAAGFGDPVLGISRSGLVPNMTLVEGLAMAITVPLGPRDLHHEVKAMREAGLAPNLETLLAPGGFWGEAPRRAYTVAGSFVRFLIDTRGVAALKRAYATGELAAAYGVSLRDLIAEWQAMLDRLPLDPRDREEALSRFHAPSIFEKPCAHEIANLESKAARAQPEEAVAVRKTIAELLGKPVSARIDLVHALHRAEAYAELWPLSEALLQDPSLTTHQRETLHDVRGQVAWERGELELARTELRAALAVQSSLPNERLHWVRIWALGRSAEEQAFLRPFLLGKVQKLPGGLELLRLSQRHPREPTYPYLLARQLQAQDAPQAAIHYLQRVQHPFVPIEAERLRMLGELHLQLGDWEASRKAYLAYVEVVPQSGEKARALDQMERITFLERNGRAPPRASWSTGWPGVVGEALEPSTVPEGEDPFALEAP